VTGTTKLGIDYTSSARVRPQVPGPPSKALLQKPPNEEPVNEPCYLSRPGDLIKMPMGDPFPLWGCRDNCRRIDIVTGDGNLLA
jgi:hypothetical protein